MKKSHRTILLTLLGVAIIGMLGSLLPRDSFPVRITISSNSTSMKPAAAVPPFDSRYASADDTRKIFDRLTNVEVEVFVNNSPLIVSIEQRLKALENEPTLLPPCVAAAVPVDSKQRRENEVKEAVAEYATNPKLGLTAFSAALDKVAAERPHFNIPGLLSWSLRDTISDSADGYGRFFSGYMRFLRQNPGVAKVMFLTLKETSQMQEMARRHASRFADGLAALSMPFNQTLGAMAANDGYQCFYGRKAGQECTELVQVFESYYRTKATFNLIWIVGSLNRTFNQGGMNAVEMFQDLGLSFMELGGVVPTRN